MRSEKHFRNPEADTWSSKKAESYYNKDADPLGRESVKAQVARDTFGTKDIQDADTATHAWIAGQVGHHTLGAVGTLIPCWIVSILTEPGPLRIAGFVFIAVGWFVVWTRKELQDFREVKRRVGDVFKLDTSDIWWNVMTALFYIGTGVVLVLFAFLGISFSIWLSARLATSGVYLPNWGVLLALFLPLILVAGVLYLPAVRIAYWWLRRKLNFQQAGLPFFYRLANFKGKIEPDEGEPNAGTVKKRIVELANATNKPIKIVDVVLRPDKEDKTRALKPSHLVISGPIGAGKTSLAVGIGNEFALSLQIGRYLTAVKLLQLLDSPAPAQDQGIPVMEKDCGRLLWPWRSSDLLIVDDVDEGKSANSQGPKALGDIVSYVTPIAFKDAVMLRTGNKGLPWLRELRSVWVVGDVSRIKDWSDVISDIIYGEHYVEEKHIKTVKLSGSINITSKSPDIAA